MTPLEIHRVVAIAEQMRDETGLGLARTWGYIHGGDYAAARECLDDVAGYNELSVDWASCSLAPHPRGSR